MINEFGRAGCYLFFTFFSTLKDKTDFVGKSRDIQVPRLPPLLRLLKSTYQRLNGNFYQLRCKVGGGEKIIVVVVRRRGAQPRSFSFDIK